jgi:PilZ domain
MEFTKRFSQFCEWHDGFKQGVLANETIERYMQARRDICGILLLGQRMAIATSAVTRGSLRVACTYQIEFGFPSGFVASTTHDISTGGLSALVAESPPVGSVIPMRLMVGGGATIVGRCQVVKIDPMQDGIRMGVAFEGMPTEAREKIETALCDVIVTKLRSTFNPQHVLLS